MLSSVLRFENDMRFVKHAMTARGITSALIFLAFAGWKQVIPQTPNYACTAKASIFEEVHNYKPLFNCSAKRGALHSEDLEVLGFRIGRSTLRDVHKRFPGSSPGSLTNDEESDVGICIKNSEGLGAVFVSGVMGSPDTITAIYLAPSRLIEKRLSRCKVVDTPSEQLSTETRIRVGITNSQISETFHRSIKADGPFCVAYVIPSAQGPLLTNNEKKAKSNVDMTDLTGVRGCMSNGKASWLALFGITSN